MSIINKLKPGPREFIEAGAFLIGLFLQIIEQGKFRSIGYFIALGPFLIIEMIEINLERKRFKDAQSTIRARLDRIDTYLKATAPDELNIAIFADLLIYLPVYVADALGFYRQEGIKVNYSIRHGDEAVANAVKSLEAQIGLCDPCMCARREFSSAGEKLFILTPLVTKSAAKPVTKHELRIRTRLLKGGKISIATYPAPSTTYVMAANLMNEMKRSSEAKGTPEVDFSLVQIEEKDFTDHNLGNLLDRYELVMLWEPLLSFAKNSPENIEFLLDTSLALPDDIMYSALVISRRMLDEKPTLGIRLFRALSRATYHIHLAVKNENLMKGVLGAAKNRRTIPLNDEKLNILLQDMIKRDCLFPLVTSPKQIYEEPEWNEQLHKALEYRFNATKLCSKDFRGDSRILVNIDECRKYFCPREYFEEARPTKTLSH